MSQLDAQLARLEQQLEVIKQTIGVTAEDAYTELFRTQNGRDPLSVVARSTAKKVNWLLGIFTAVGVGVATQTILNWKTLEVQLRMEQYVQAGRLEARDAAELSRMNAELLREEVIPSMKEQK